MLIYRELDPTEFDKIPAEALDGELPIAGGIRIFAGLDKNSGKIMAIWCVLAVVHAEPVWLAKEVRHSPTVLRRLAEGMKGILRSMGQSKAVAIIPADAPKTKRIAQWLGAKELPGRML